MSIYSLDIIADGLEKLAKDAKASAEKFSDRFYKMEDERDKLADLLQEVRYYCFCDKPMNLSILKLIERTVRDELKYDAPIWTRQYPVTDETGAESGGVIAGAELYVKLGGKA